MVESKVGKTRIDNKLMAYRMPVIRLDNEQTNPLKGPLLDKVPWPLCGFEYGSTISHFILTAV
jgi:hypothetical protein